MTKSVDGPVGSNGEQKVNPGRMRQFPDLLPCPFCGRVPSLERDENMAWIMCPEDSVCRGSGVIMAFTLNKIGYGVKVWNTRVSSQQGKEVV